MLADRRCNSPAACAGPEFIDDERPVVERGGIEVRPIGPYERVDFRIEVNPSKEFRILKRPVQLASKYRREIDRLLRAVSEVDAQQVGTDALKRCHPMEWVGTHNSIVAAQSATPVCLTAVGPNLL